MLLVKKSIINAWVFVSVFGNDTTLLLPQKRKQK